MGKRATSDAGSISSELVVCVGVPSVLELPFVVRCLETIDVLVLAGLCLTVVVTPSIKISLPNREGPIKRSFSEHIARIHTMPYEERLNHLNLYSVQMRRDRYQIIYLWKIIEKFVPNLFDPITCTYSERSGISSAV